MRLPWRPAIALTLAMFAAIGCAPAIPRYQWTTDQAALDELARRARAIKTIEATCAITLRDENHQHITLDGALVARQPDHLRIRAWKFEHAVFDLTATPDGVWIDADKRDDRINHAALVENVRQAWALFGGEFFTREIAVDHSRRNAKEVKLIERTPQHDGTNKSCIVNKRSLIPLRYEVRAADDSLLYAIRMENHRALGDIIWPRRITFERGENSMMFNFSEIEFNSGLNPHAFTPPSRAVRQP